MTRFFVEDPRPLLKRLGVDTSSPGFYDDPKFVAQEQNDPTFLDSYASFVRHVSRTAEYDAEAGRRIRDVCDFLYEELATDGRLGACVDISMGVSRFLERLGVWNYCAKGGITIEFDESVGRPSICLAPVGGRQEKAAGHAWVVAPPFEVVDVSVRLQPYRHEIGEFLPLYVMAKQVRATSATVADWVDPDDLNAFVLSKGRMPTMSDLKGLMGSQLVEWSRRYGIHYVDEPPVHIKYMTCGVSAPSAPFEEMSCLRLNGKDTVALWTQFVEQHPEYALGKRL